MALLLKSATLLIVIGLQSLAYPAVADEVKERSVLLVGAGDIAQLDHATEAQATADLTRKILISAPTDYSKFVFTLGDNTYQTNDMTLYDSTWGEFKTITFPVIGNHDRYYNDSGFIGSASGYSQYFLEKFPYFKLGQFYYYIDFPDSPWSILMLDSTYYEFDGKGGYLDGHHTLIEEELKYVDDYFDRHKDRCVIAMWHHPACNTCCIPFKGSHNVCTAVDAKKDPDDLSFRKRIWAQVAGRASVALVGHEHIYRRFHPMNKDLETAPKGLTQIVVGTGGAQDHNTTPCNDPNQCDFPYNDRGEFQNGQGEIQPDETAVGPMNADGVLRLELHPNSDGEARAFGTWDFITTQSFPKSVDAGTFECVGNSD